MTILSYDKNDVLFPQVKVSWFDHQTSAEIYVLYSSIQTSVKHSGWIWKPQTIVWCLTEFNSKSHESLTAAAVTWAFIVIFIWKFHECLCDLWGFDWQESCSVRIVTIVQTLVSALTRVSELSPLSTFLTGRCHRGHWDCELWILTEGRIENNWEFEFLSRGASG